MTDPEPDADQTAPPAPDPHRRRPRYRGRNPRRFEEKYKERDPEKYPDLVAHVLAAGKTPAGMHVPIMVAEVVEVLAPAPGLIAVDCTLGYGGHARELLAHLQPGGRLIGLDVDPIEQPRTEARLRATGFGPDLLTIHRSNFAGLPAVLARENLAGADLILADLGLSSMQIDTPDRGFSLKAPGPLDMRMNPHRGLPAAEVLERITPAALASLLTSNADEPHATHLASALAGQEFILTTDLADAIRESLSDLEPDEREKSVRRVFQALRIAVNDEFSALDALLRTLPLCLNPGGRVAILTFHSGEDRRVKHAFRDGQRLGHYATISPEPIRPSPAECRNNPRATSAKLRWASRGED